MRILAPTLLLIACAVGEARSEEPKPLPSPAKFDPARYMGKWYEVARLPTPVQPEGTLATAEYSPGDKEGTVIVKNTAYDAEGKLIRALEGQAELAGGEQKGRLKVSFGPVVPDAPNYCVLRLGKNYQISVVGSPDRKSLWILSRKIPVPKKRVLRLAAVAERAGYDISDLSIAEWPENFAQAPVEAAAAGKSNVAGKWTLHLEGPGGEGVDLPMELAVDGGAVTGRVGRGDGRWLEIRDGKVDGDTFTMSIVRDRPQGGSMTYALEGKFADGKLTGTAKTEIEGRGEITSEWDADPSPDAGDEQ